MHLQTGKPLRRRLLSALALSASVMQVLGCALPSLVVCYKADRPPRVEFFSDSCSCHLEEIHSGSDRDGRGVPGLGGSCTDIHLNSHALFVARVNRQPASTPCPRHVSGSEAYAPGSVFANPLPAAATGGPPGAGSPPPFSLVCADSLLRC